MSKKWTPELDSILIHGIFEECQISFGKALCEKMAERIRAAGVEGFTECTPKAIENRLYSWKKKNTTTSTSTSGETPTSTPKKAASRPKKDATTPKTPRAKKGAAKKAGSEEDADEVESLEKGRKRATGIEEVVEEKKVKREPVDDDEGESLGAADEEEEI